MEIHYLDADGEVIATGVRPEPSREVRAHRAKLRQESLERCQRILAGEEEPTIGVIDPETGLTHHFRLNADPETARRRWAADPLGTRFWNPRVPNGEARPMRAQRNGRQPHGARRIVRSSPSRGDPSPPDSEDDDLARQRQIAAEAGFSHISEGIEAELKRLTEGRS
jgi:hypothetical protein